MRRVLLVGGITGLSIVAGTSAALGATNPLAPPSGSTTLQAPETLQGVQYARYSSSSMNPNQVVAFYTKQLQAAGYQTVNEGGGGSGWSSGWGGGGGGLTAINNGVYVSINAGGDGTPTYFEVCSGKNSQIVDNCQNLSEDAQSTSGGS